MTILGVETSTAVCSVGLVQDKDISVERSLVETHIHSEKLQTLILDVLREGQSTLQTVKAIAVSIGPGSFTGLRIGLSTAKGLCYAVDKPLITVPTFDAIASAAARHQRNFSRYVILMDAKQKDFYYGIFRRADQGVEAVGKVAVKPLEEILQELRIDDGTLLITDSAEKVKELVAANAACQHVHMYCRGDVVARIGRRKYMSKEFSDLASAEPMYLKDFVVRDEAVGVRG